MTTCYAPGALRAYLDGELPAAEAAGVDEHLAACPECAAQLDELRTLDGGLSDAFSGLGEPAAPDADAAYALLQTRLHAGSVARPASGRSVARFIRRRPMYAGVAVAAALLIVLLVPPLRTAADSALSVFSGQKAVFVSVPQTRVNQLANLKVDPNTLFLSKPAEVGTPAAPTNVSTPADAAPLLGFTPAVPTAFTSAPVSETYSVEGQTSYSAQVNVRTLRAVLTSLGVTDVTIPDALGSRPITIVLPPAMQARYQGKDYSVSLIEGTSPVVNLPDGVDLSQLGRAVLEVYGMSPQDAARLSQKIDWRSTLVFPFPLGTNVLEQVNINGTQGVLLTTGGNQGLLRSSSSKSVNSQGTPSTTGGSADNSLDTLVYWQQGSRFYILNAQGSLSRDDIVVLAGSIR